MQAGTKLKAGLILNDVQQREITAKKPEFAGADIDVRDAWNRPDWCDNIGRSRNSSATAHIRKPATGDVKQTS